MKACVLSDWNRQEIRELPIPQLSDGEALIEVIYGGVCGSDVTVTNHKHPTATIPRIPYGFGHDPDAQGRGRRVRREGRDV